MYMYMYCTGTYMYMYNILEYNKVQHMVIPSVQLDFLAWQAESDQSRASQV